MRPVVSDSAIQNLIQKATDAGQKHLFAWWDTISTSEKEQFIQQLQTVDFALMASLAGQLHQEDEGIDMSRFSPPALYKIPKTKTETENVQLIREQGEDAIKNGQLGIFVVAGGQGSRLGFDGPKGAFPIGPVSNKSLFQIFAEKIQAASKKYNVTIPWYIMTSETNHHATKAFFERHQYFGLNSNDVMFFNQKMLPAVDEQGKLILDAKHHLFMSPNGHGGSLLALYESGALADMQKRGINIISYFQVDNPLAQIVDPVFIGYHLKDCSEMSTKAIKRIDPQEKVGMLGMYKGQLRVVEYSDMRDEDMTAKDKNGDLKYNAGSIGIHLFDVDFVKSIAADGLKLPWHIAHKKIPSVNEQGMTVSPNEPNGYKFETFVFDGLLYAERTVIMQIDKSLEFSPVKNATGKDSPQTTKQDMMNLYASWLEESGIAIQKDYYGNVMRKIEISPLFANSSQELAKKISDNLKIEETLYLE